MFQTLITGIICLMGFGVGIVYVTPGGQAILSLVDFFGGGFIIFVIAIIEVISVRYKNNSISEKNIDNTFIFSWIYGLERLFNDIRFMMDISLGFYWKFCLKFFVPVSLLAIFIYFIVTYEHLTYQGFQYPPAAVYGGWILTAFALAQIPLWFLHSLCTGENRGCISVFKPNSDWGPAKPRDRDSWINQLQTTEL